VAHARVGCSRRSRRLWCRYPWLGVSRHLVLRRRLRRERVAKQAARRDVASVRAYARASVCAGESEETRSSGNQRTNQHPPSLSQPTEVIANSPDSSPMEPVCMKPKVICVKMMSMCGWIRRNAVKSTRGAGGGGWVRRNEYVWVGQLTNLRQEDELVLFEQAAAHPEEDHPTDAQPQVLAASLDVVVVDGLLHALEEELGE